MTRGPDERAPTNEPLTTADDDAYLVLLEQEVVTRLRPLLGGGHTRCRITCTGRRIEVDIAGPPLDEGSRHAVGVRVLDAVRAMGHTVGDVEVTYATRFSPSTPPSEPTVQARAGDRVIVKGHHVGEPDRDGEILEVRGSGGGPPYRVRWGDNGRETLFFPGPDAEVQHFDHLGR